MIINLEGVSIKITSPEMENKVKAIILGSTTKRTYKQKKYTHLTAEEIDVIREMYHAKQSIVKIAKAIGRSYPNVWAHIQLLKRQEAIKKVV